MDAGTDLTSVTSTRTVEMAEEVKWQESIETELFPFQAVRSIHVGLALDPSIWAASALALLDWKVLRWPALSDGYRLRVVWDTAQKEWRMDLQLHVMEVARLLDQVTASYADKHKQFLDAAQRYCALVVRQTRSDADWEPNNWPFSSLSASCRFGETCYLVTRKGSGRCPQDLPLASHLRKCRQCSYTPPTTALVSGCQPEAAELGFFTRPSESDFGHRDFLVMGQHNVRTEWHSNRTMATSSTFWTQVQKLLKQLCVDGLLSETIEELRFNFGRWDRAAQHDPRLECHGHLHVIPTLIGVQAWIRKNQVAAEAACPWSSSDRDPFAQAFTGWVRKPNDDPHIKDCAEVISQFVTPARLERVEARLDTIEQTLKRRFDELETLIRSTR